MDEEPRSEPEVVSSETATEVPAETDNTADARISAIQSRCETLEARCAGQDEILEGFDARLARLEHASVSSELITAATETTVAVPAPGSDMIVEQTATETVTEPSGNTETLTVSRRRYRRI